MLTRHAQPVRFGGQSIQDGVLLSLPLGRKLPQTRNHLLMVRPTVFSLSGEINAWMKTQNRPDPVLALEQWSALYETLERIGFTIDEERQPEAWPDYVFAANAGLAVGVNGKPVFIASRFVHPERKGEEALFEAAFAARGFEVVHLLEDSETWEGEGDMLEHNGVLFGGYGWRSRVSAHHKVANYLGLPVITLHLARSHFYHLDTALAFLDDRTALWYPDAFEINSRLALRAHMDAIPDSRLLAVREEDARRFACNAIPLGQDIVMNDVSDELVERLAREGFTVHRTPLSEFLKSGGAAKCLTKFLPAFGISRGKS